MTWFAYRAFGELTITLTDKPWATTDWPGRSGRYPYTADIGYRSRGGFELESHRYWLTAADQGAARIEALERAIEFAEGLPAGGEDEGLLADTLQQLRTALHTERGFSEDRPMEQQPTGALHVYRSEYDFFVAENLAQAIEFARHHHTDTCGEPAETFEADLWALDDNHSLCLDGFEDGASLQLTCLEWTKRSGRGYLASTES